MPRKATSPRVECSCLKCGQSFFVFPHRLRDGRGVYCSKACLYGDRARRLALPPNCVCIVCGTAFQRKPSRIRKYCSKACARAPEPLYQRFWRQVEYGGPGCWPWIGARTRRGYGIITLGTRADHWCARATRVMWRLVHGEDPVFACHRCDNPPCCRPSHIYNGTPRENAQDMWQRGRARTPPPGRAHAARPERGPP
jgi:hypothetical protein